MINNASLHKSLDESIAHQNPEAIALAFIRELNAEGDNNYPFTKRQHELLTELVKEYQSHGVIFAPDVIANIAYNADELEDGFEDIAAILNDIFESIDENGQDLPENEQPFHFDSYPFPIK